MDAIRDAYRLIENASDEDIIRIDSNTNVQAILQRTIIKAKRLLQLAQTKAADSQQPNTQLLGVSQQIPPQALQKRKSRASSSRPSKRLRLRDPVFSEQCISKGNEDKVPLQPGSAVKDRGPDIDRILESLEGSWTRFEMLRGLKLEDIRPHFSRCQDFREQVLDAKYCTKVCLLFQQSLARQSLAHEYILELVESTRNDSTTILKAIVQGHVFKNPQETMAAFLIRHNLKNSTDWHIRIGLNLLILELYCEIRPLAAIFAFSSERLRKIPPKELPNLAQRLSSSQFSVELRSKATKQWFTNCWNHFHPPGHRLHKLSVAGIDVQSSTSVADNGELPRADLQSLESDDGSGVLDNFAAPISSEQYGTVSESMALLESQSTENFEVVSNDISHSQTTIEEADFDVNASYYRPGLVTDFDVNASYHQPGSVADFDVNASYYRPGQHAGFDMNSLFHQDANFDISSPFNQAGHIASLDTGAPYPQTIAS